MGTYLPLSSLRLVVPPLRLMSAFMWQVIQRRNITHYGKLEQFVRLVSDTVPELMSASQTTKLIIGLRKRVILELCREDAPFNSVIIEAHLETLRKLVSKDEESVTHSNFMKLVRKMLANPAKRDDFFKGTFSVEYGASFDEALQELAWEFLIRIEELLLVPSLKETASWLYDATSAVEDIVQPLSDPADLKDLLQHFKSVRLSHQSALISFVDATGQTFLISQSEPNQAITNIISSVANDAEDVETLIDNVEYTIVNTETAEDQAWENAGCDEQQTLVLDQGHLSTGITEEGAPDLQNDTGGITQFPVNQQPRSLVSGVVTSGTPPSQLDGTPPLAAVLHTEEPPVRQVNLQQWISEIAGTIVSLPVLPPVPENGTGRKVYAGDMILGENVEISADATPEGPKKALIRRKSNSKHTQEILTGNAVLAEAEAIQAIQGKHTCPECGKEFRYGCLLKDHLRTHTGEKPFQCSDCGKSFRCLNLLTNHLKIHSAGKPFKCTECEKAFHKRPDLVKHLRVHTGEKPYKCNICGKSFTQGTYLKIHRECHTSQSLHRCPHCEKTYPTAFKLAVHVRYHTMERAYQCHLCGRSFVYGSLLRRHMGYHVSERQFLCAICGKAFVYLFDLKKHQRNHEKPRPRVSCSLCPKTFAGNEMLRNHMRIHTGERPYQCKECGRSFSQIGNMKRHQRVHTGERPFTCEQCGKTYKHSSHLKDHMLTHTGERPWQCEQCGKSFKSAERRKKHEATHSAERQKSYENSRGRKKQDAKNC